MFQAEEIANFEVLRDCLSLPLVEKFATEPGRLEKKKRKSRKDRKRSEIIHVDEGAEDNSNYNADELAEFIDYIATEVFTCLPEELRALTFSTFTNNSCLQERYNPPLSASSAAHILLGLDPTVVDTLTTYGLLPDAYTPIELLHPVLNSYITNITSAPLPPSQTKIFAYGCEICDREHLPLTYHHLVPKFAHEKALRRGWHTKDQLNNVAWLCRACHSFVHSIASHEELARDLHTLELLLEKEEVRRFAKWVGRVRWKAR